MKSHQTENRRRAGEFDPSAGGQPPSLAVPKWLPQSCHPQFMQGRDLDANILL
jgi:hypothetical protein